MPTVTIEESDVTLAEILSRVKTGNEVIVTRDNIAVARVLPVADDTEPRRPQLGTAAGQAWMSDDFDDPLPEFDEYR